MANIFFTYNPNRFFPLVVKLVLLSLILLSASTGCVLTMGKPFLKERTLEKGIIPNIVGKWKDEEGAVLTVSATKSTNTFTAVSNDKDQVLKITMERLNDTQFIIQFQPSTEQGEGVFLTVGEVSDRRISIYTFQDSLPDLRKKAEANGVTINEVGLITKYENAQGIVKFFHEMAATPGHVDLILTK